MSVCLLVCLLTLAKQKERKTCHEINGFVTDPLVSPIPSMLVHNAFLPRQSPIIRALAHRTWRVVGRWFKTRVLEIFENFSFDPASKATPGNWYKRKQMRLLESSSLNPQAAKKLNPI
jgi:hypothetical protein